MTLKNLFGVGLVVAVVVLAALVAGVAPHHSDAIAGVGMAITALPAALPRDLVSLQALRATAYAEMETALGSPTGQADFDAAGANVETLDVAIANAAKLQKLRGSKAVASPNI